MKSSKLRKLKKASLNDQLKIGIQGFQISPGASHLESSMKFSKRRRCDKLQKEDGEGHEASKELGSHLGYEYSFHDDKKKKNCKEEDPDMVKFANTKGSKEFESLAHSTNPPELNFGNYSPRISKETGNSRTATLNQNTHPQSKQELKDYKSQSSRHAINIKANQYHGQPPPWGGTNYINIASFKDQTTQIVPTRESVASLNSSQEFVSGFAKQGPLAHKQHTSIGTLLGTQKHLSEHTMLQKGTNKQESPRFINAKLGQSPRQVCKTLKRGTQQMKNVNSSLTEQVKNKEGADSEALEGRYDNSNNPSVTEIQNHESKRRPSNDGLQLSDMTNKIASGESQLKEGQPRTGKRRSIPAGGGTNRDASAAKIPSESLLEDTKVQDTYVKGKASESQFNNSHLESSQAKADLQAVEIQDASVEMKKKVLRDIEMMDQLGGSRREEHEEGSPVGHSWGDGDHVYADDRSKEKPHSVIQDDDTPKNDISKKEFLLHKMSDRQKQVDRVNLLKQKASIKSSQESSAERNTFQDSKIETGDEIQRQESMPPYSIHRNFDNMQSIKYSRDQKKRKDLLPQNCFPPSYSRPTQKSAQNNRVKKVSLIADMKNKCDPERRLNDIFFGSKISYEHNTEIALSDRRPKEEAMSEGFQQKTMSTDTFAYTLAEKNMQFNNIKKQIVVSHNKLTKNLGNVYNKLALDEITNQKKQFVDVTLKKSFIPGQKIQQGQLKLIQQKKQKEQQIQQMDTKNFIDFLNRDNLVAKSNSKFNYQARNSCIQSQDISPIAFRKFDQVKQSQNTPLGTPHEAYSRMFNEPLTPTTCKPHSTLKKQPQNLLFQTQKESTQRRSLNRYQFRKPLNITRNMGSFLQSTQRRRAKNPFYNTQGCDNYEYALNLESPREKPKGILKNEPQRLGVYPDNEINLDAKFEVESIGRHNRDEDELSMEVMQHKSMRGNKLVHNKSNLPQRRVLTKQEQGQKKPSMISLEGSKSLIDQYQIGQQFYDTSHQSVKSDKQLPLNQFSDYNENNIHHDPLIEKFSVNSKERAQIMSEDFNSKEKIQKQLIADNSRKSFSPETKPEKNKTPRLQPQPKQKTVPGSPASKGSKDGRVENAQLPQQPSLPSTKILQKMKTVSPTANVQLQRRATIQIKKLKSQQRISELYEQFARKLEERSEAYDSPYDTQTSEVERQNDYAQAMEDYMWELEANKLQKLLMAKSNVAIDTTAISRQIRNLNQTCERLVTGNNQQPEIDINQPLRIELSSSTASGLFYRCEIKGEKSPLKITVEYHGIQPKVCNMELFLSTVDENPTGPSNYEIKVRPQDFTSSQSSSADKTRYYLSADKIGATSTANQLQEQARQAKTRNSAIGQKPIHEATVFKDKYLYLGIVVSSACSITLSLKTIESRQDANKVKLKQYKEARAKFFKEADGKFNMNDAYYREMKENEELTKQRTEEYQQMIMERGFSDMFYPDPSKDKQKFKEFNKRLKQTYNKKDRDETWEHKRKLFLVYRQQVLKLITIYHKEEAESKYKRIRRARNLITIINQHQIFQKCYQSFMTERANIAMEEAKIWSAIRIRRRYLAYGRRLGPNVLTRGNQRIKQTLAYAGVMMHDRRYINSRESFTSFVKHWGSKEILKSKIRECQNRLYTMTKKMKSNILANQLRVDILKGEIWKKQRDKLMLILTKKGLGKKQQELRKKICETNDNVKDAIVDAYYKKQKLHSRVEFMEWFIEKEDQLVEKDPNYVRTYANQSKYTGYQNQLDVLKKAKSDLESFLKKGVSDYKFSSAGKGKRVESPAPDECCFLTQANSPHRHRHTFSVQDFLKKPLPDGCGYPPTFRLLEKKNPQCIRQLLVKAAIMSKDDKLKLQGIYALHGLKLMTESM